MYPLFKRLFDIGLTLTSLVVLSPVIIVIAVLIKITDSGPVFYRGVRVGRGNRPFIMLKFRTMVANADKIGVSSTALDDPRITSIGRFLRRYKLDELPQLFNVLVGEMSFVGPRPEIQKFVDLFTEEESAILSVPPGITDWASLWNSDEGAILAGSPDPDRDYLVKIRPIKIRFQLEYVKKRSFLVDMGILIRTGIAVLSKSKAPALADIERDSQDVTNS